MVLPSRCGRDPATTPPRANPRAWTWGTQRIETGRSHDGWWRVYQGYLDDVRFYNVQPTDSQIAQIVAGDAPVVAPDNLVGRYNFDTGPTLGLRITWPMGVLEHADHLDGEYTPVPNAVTLFVIEPAEARKFYRVRL